MDTGGFVWRRVLSGSSDDLPSLIEGLVVLEREPPMSHVFTNRESKDVGRDR